ncbi:hypothetical protein ACOMHN_036522 [Nucella lapillus]
MLNQGGTVRLVGLVAWAPPTPDPPEDPHCTPPPPSSTSSKSPDPERPIGDGEEFRSGAGGARLFVNTRLDGTVRRNVSRRLQLQEFMVMLRLLLLLLLLEGSSGVEVMLGRRGGGGGGEQGRHIHSSGLWRSASRGGGGGGGGGERLPAIQVTRCVLA